TAGSAVGKNRDVGLFEEAQFADDAVAPSMRARAARVRANAIGLDLERVFVLEGFNRRVPAVGHVGMDGGASIRLRRGAHATRNRFVIGERAVAKFVPSAEADVIHGTGACGGNALRDR